MTIISKIQSAIPVVQRAAQTISGKPLGIASKVLGAATVVGILYDSHVNGKEKAYSLEQINMADRYSNQYKQYMTMDKRSATTATLKKWLFDSQQTLSLCNIKDKVVGYCSGFFNTVSGSLPLIALSAIALKFKNVGKVAGVLLALNATKSVLYDVLGVGHKKEKL